MGTPAERLGNFLIEIEAQPQTDVFRMDIQEPKEIRDIVSEAVGRLIPGIEIETTKLMVGDYSFRGIGFERKSFDYANYPMVKQQCIEMMEAYERAFLILDVDLNSIMMDMFEHNPKKAESLPGFTASLVEIGMSPIFCSDPETMAEVMVKICIKSYDHKDRTYKEPFRPRVSKSDRILHIIKAISGVSTERGKSLLREFHSISCIAGATVDDLQKVEGIGPKTAKAIHEAFRGEWGVDENHEREK